jgi:hypothetical protein
MARIPPRIFAVRVELDGKAYSMQCASYAGVVMLLHPLYNRGGAIVKRGESPERTAEALFQSGLKRLKACGELH